MRVKILRFGNKYFGRMKKLYKDNFLFNHCVEEEYVRVFLFYIVGNCFFKSRDNVIRIGWMTCIIANNVKDLDFGGAIYTHLIRGMDVVIRTERLGSLEGFNVILSVRKCLLHVVLTRLMLFFHHLHLFQQKFIAVTTKRCI